MKRFFIHTENSFFKKDYNEAIETLLHYFCGISVEDMYYPFKNMIGYLINCDVDGEEVVNKILPQEIVYEFNEEEP